MTNGSGALRYAVRPLVIGKYLGQLGFVLALLTLAPAGASLLFGEFDMTLRYATVVLLLLLLAGLSRRLPAPDNLQQNEALVIVALAFLLSPLLMSYPLGGAALSWSDAAFEAISGVTTTGLSTIANLDAMPATFLFARSWSQWYGGLGIVVLSTALLQGHYVSSRRLIESTTGEELATTTRTFARRTLAVYLLLTAAGVGVLMLLGMDATSALEHSLSAVSTGGFTPDSQSLAPAGPALALAVVSIGLLGAVPFHLYFLIRQGSLRHATQDPELWLLGALVTATAALLGTVLANGGMPWGAALYHALVQAVSAQSTSGFSTLPAAELGDAGKLTLIFSMFVGGGLGSTAGGIKLLRLLILFRLAQLLLQRSGMPRRAVTVTTLGGAPLRDSEIQASLLLVLLFALVVLASWLVFVIFGYPPLDALFEVVSATATVGLSTGITSSGLEPALRAVLCADMLVGRVEVVAMLVVLYPPTWLGKRAEI